MHQSRTHDMNTFSCEKCGENVVGKETLNNHMRKHNTAVGKLKQIRKCDVCPYETKDHANLRKHTKRVHSEKPEKVKKSRDCTDCGKTFLRKDKFDNHVKVHHKNDAPLETCKDCDHKFSKSDDLERHVKTVHERIKKVTSKPGFGTFKTNFAMLFVF